MKLHRGSIYVVALVAAASLTVGCGQGMNATGSASQGTTLVNDPILPDNSLEKIEAEAASAEAALVEAQATLDSIIKNGRVDLSAASSASGVSAQSLTGIAEKLQEILDKVLAKITLPVQKAKDLLNKARQQVATAMAMLDPNNPAHATAIAKLQEMMQRLDALEARLAGVYKMLGDRVDILVGTIDKLIAKLTASGNPLMLIVVYELTEVRDVLADFADKLAAI